jgi:hypothetical protein
MLLRDLDPKKLHHAYVIDSASVLDAKSALEEFISKKMGVSFHGNPDVFIGEYGSIGIDDLSDVTSMHQRVAIGPKKIIILSAAGITMQAQNSILKMIEEPTHDTYFFFILPSIALLLPTVLSRVHVIQVDQTYLKKDPKVSEFIEASTPDRLDIVKEFMTDLDKERISKEEVFKFISAVVGVAHLKHKDAETLSVISRVTDYLRDPSSSLKLLFEYLALRLPR